MPRIRKVVDLRTGMVHPTRDRKGRFLARKRAARHVSYYAGAWDNVVWTPRDLSRFAPVMADRRYLP